MEIAPSSKIVGRNAGQGFVLRLKKMAVGAPASRQITATNWTGVVDNKVEARITWTKNKAELENEKERKKILTNICNM